MRAACGTVRVVANRVLEPLGVGERVLAGLQAGPTRDAAALHRALRAEQKHWLSMLEPERRLSHRFGVLTPPEVAARLAEELA